MPNETISVVYEPLDSVAGVSFYHETLVYTNSDGQQFIATAAHSGEPTSSSDTYNISQAAGAAATDGSSVYGVITHPTRH